VKRRWIILAAIGTSMTLLDQATKFLAVKHLTPALAGVESLPDQVSRFYGDVEHPCRGMATRCPNISFIDGLWSWRYVQNPGAAWGLLARADESVRIPFFLAISIGALAFIIAFFRKLTDEQHLLVIALSLVFGGAIGNFIDRLHLAYVIDFIDWYLGSVHWPTFNVADAAISTGVGLLVLDWVRDAIKSRAEAKASPEESSA
jgi:signal peptidase II